MMQYITTISPGASDVLKLTDGPIPEPGEGEVLVRVAAAGLNRADIAQRQGNYPPPPGASPILGMELAGTIEMCGPNVSSWRAGDSVCALVSGGAYAEYCVAPAAQCLPIPGKVTMAEAASLPEALFTVWTNVFQRGRLTAGETFLVHGGSSGIGTAAIQLAHQFGARVIADAGSEEKCAACRALGADLAIPYKTQDFVAEAKRFTDGRGVDVILDMVGGSYFARNLAALAREGRLVNIAFQQGSRIEADLTPIMLKRLTVTGSTLRTRSVAEKGAIAAELRDKVWPLLESGAVKPLVYRTFPLAEAAQAHLLMESSEHIGKIVLTMDAA
ncbi:NAD(P)H quinone oxidoreductase [Capsulimonas corticalis]|uniref:NAD(P)H quinone oxidoreductase n=1 Tax=Capsulimonas corticalis TaxID=2219043 RepID=A0A402CV07_9BACT|nr:NAD(P)H-quinone oxidoreductase [Capsulimonas corticalis]BDI30243.1 NAD(P)H quinone oxidoreductase [Capsulimonas corticalis]